MSSEPANPLATGVTAELYKAAIGLEGQDYYLRHFLKFDADGKTSASWHWPAYWSTLNWLVFRKMRGRALAYGMALVGLVLVIFGVGKLLFNYSDSTGLLLFLLFLTAAFVLPGLYANAWYYTDCSKQITAALRDAATVKEACDVLAGQASTRRRWFGMVAANVAMLALLASGLALVLNRGQEGGYLAQMQRAKPVAADVTVALPPAVAPANLVGAEPASPAQSASPPAPVTAMPAAATPSEPLPVTAASTDKLTSTVAPDQAVASAAGAGTDAKPQAVIARRPWFVQVGAFAKDANAQNVRTKVEATGLVSAAEPSDTPAGRLIRVRVGPFDSKGEAERAALQIKALELPAVLVRP